MGRKTPGLGAVAVLLTRHWFRPSSCGCVWQAELAGVEASPLLGSWSTPGIGGALPPLGVGCLTLGGTQATRSFNGS